MVDRVSRSFCWMVVAAFLDVAAWSAFRPVPFLAANPGTASALALCWVQVFVLPPLLARPWRGLARLAADAAIGVAAASAALVVGIIAGLQVGAFALLTMFAFTGPYTGAYRDPPGPVLHLVEDGLGDVVLWSGPAAGSAAALVVAVGLAALRPGTRRPRLSWRLVVSGAWASVVLLPDWLVMALRPPWREPVLLIAAGLPGILVLLGRDGTTSG